MSGCGWIRGEELGRCVLSFRTRLGSTCTLSCILEGCLSASESFSEPSTVLDFFFFLFLCMKSAMGAVYLFDFLPFCTQTVGS